MINNKDIERVLKEAKEGYYLVNDELEQDDYFMEYYNDEIDEILKDYRTYLVVAYNSTWNGSTGYKLTTDKMDAFLRTYDYTQELISVSKGHKACELREYHHDVPTGHKVVIVGLTDKEADRLEYASFDDILKFASKY